MTRSLLLGLLLAALALPGCDWFSDEVVESSQQRQNGTQQADAATETGPGASHTGQPGHDDVAPLSLNPWSWQPPASERVAALDAYGNALPPGAVQRFGDDDLRHAGPVYDLEATPDGRTLVSAGADGRVELWDANTGKRLRPPLVHPGPVRAVAIPGGAQRRIVSVTDDGIVRIWQLPDAWLALEHPTGLDPIGALAVSPDGTRLAAAGDDALVHLYTLGARTEPTDDAPPGDDGVPDDPVDDDDSGSPDDDTQPDAPPDGATPATDADKTPHDDQAGDDSDTPATEDDATPPVPGDEDGASPEAPGSAGPTDTARTPPDPAAPLADDAAADDDDDDVAPGTDDAPPADATAAEPTRVALQVTGEVTLAGHGDTIEALAWSPDGARLASLDEGGLLLVHDLASQTVTVRLEGLTSAGRHHIIWSPDGQRVAVSGDTVQLVDATSGEQLATLPGDRPLTMSDVAFLDGGSTLVSSHGAALRFWDATTGASRGPAVGTRRPAPIAVLAVAGEPQRLAVAQDRGIVLLDPATERILRAPAGHTDAITALAVVPTAADAEPRVVSASLDGTVELWNPRTARRILELAHPAAVTDLDIDPNGHVLITASPLSVPHTWRLPEGTLHRALDDLEGIAHVALLDAGRVAALTDSSGSLYLVDTDSGQRLRTLSLDGRPVIDMVATPDRQSLALIVEREGATHVEIHDLDTLLADEPPREGRRRRPATPTLGTPRLALETWLEGGTPHTFAFGPGGHRLAVASRDPLVGGLVALYDLTPEAAGRRLVGTLDRIDVRRLAFSPDGGVLLAAGGDGRLTVIDTHLHDGRERAGKLTRRITLDGHDAAITALATVPDSDLVVTGSVDTTALLWDLGALRGYVAPYAPSATTAPAPQPAPDTPAAPPSSDDATPPETD